MSRRRGRAATRAATLLVGSLLAALAILGPTAVPALAAQRVSFNQAQTQFECTVCHEPLNEARSDEAYQENALIRQLIAKGETLPQIKRVMIAQYGAGVLAVPPARGFGLLAFVVPGAIIALALACFAFLIPRWRRRAITESRAAPARTGSTISDDDAQRLDADLARQP